MPLSCGILSWTKAQGWVCSAIASSIAIDLLDATTPMHASARTRKRIVLSDDEDSLEEDVGYSFCIP